MNKLCIVLSFLILFPIVNASPPDFYIVNVTPVNVEPGEYYLLNITLKNLGTDFATYVRTYLDPTDLSPVDPIGVVKRFTVKKANEAKESQRYFGSVLQNEKITLSYKIRIKDGAEEGVYPVPLIVEFLDPNMVKLNQSLYFGINVIPKAQLTITGINTSPSRVYPGDEFTLTIEMGNIGKGDAKEVSLILSLPQYFSGDNIAYLGTINRDSTKVAEFALKAEKKIDPGKYNFTLIIRFKDGEGKKEEIKNFPLYISERGEIDIEIAGITTSPSKVYPGLPFTLSVQLENIGKQEAKAIRAYIEPEGEFVGEKTSFVGSLKKDDLGTAIFEMKAKEDIKPGNYNFKMKIYYIDERGIEHSDEKSFELVILEKPRRSYYPLIAIILIISGIGWYLKRRR